MMNATLLEREQKKISPVAREYDKRYFPRWEVIKRVEYSEGGGAVFRSYTKDLSLEGASIFVFGNFPAQHHVQLKIQLTDKANFEAQGRIAWSKLEPTHKLLGIVFENLSKKAQQSMLFHAFEIRKDNFFMEN